jgi:4-hydroxybenzoate polyprenyltransferase
MLHPPVWTIVILGYHYAPPETVSNTGLIFLLLIASAAAAWAYIVNQISDIDSDRINNKLYFLPRGIISLRCAYVMAAVTFCLTLTGGFLYSGIMGFLFAVGLIFGYIYSGKPFYAKNHPLGSVLANGIAHGPLLFLAGYVGAGGILSSGIVPSIPYFFAVAAVFIGTTIPDIAGDFKSGKITPAVALGMQKATMYMTLSLLITLLFSLITRDWPLVIVAGLSLPFYIAAVIKSNEPWTIVSIKISILLLSLAACYEFRPYAVILVILYLTTRLYYRRRFDLVYPGL